MVYRGLIVEKPKNIDNGLKFMLWLLLLLNRYYYPMLVLDIALFSIGAAAMGDLKFLASGVLLLEVFYLSIAFHEACHMSFAKFVNVETCSVSIVPYSAEVRVNFSHEKTIPPEDLYAILFAGPFLSICIGVVIAIFALSLRLDLSVLILCGVFVLINILSLLPFGGTDGNRVYAYIKVKPSYIKTLLFASIYCVYEKSGLKALERMRT